MLSSIMGLMLSQRDRILLVEPAYRAVADQVIDVDGLHPEAVATAILFALTVRSAG